MLTNHTSILTGVGPGRHGGLRNVFYDRATGTRVVPPTSWTRTTPGRSRSTTSPSSSPAAVGERRSAPTLTWWANTVTDAGHHPAGPRSKLAHETLRQSDARLVAFLEHLDRLGVSDQVTSLLTADHGFEGTDPSVTGSWRPALDALGLPYRDKGPGFVYLL